MCFVPRFTSCWQVSYRRIPLFCERTPVPQDLNDLYTQIIRKPFPRFDLRLAERCSGPWWNDHTPLSMSAVSIDTTPTNKHMFRSRCISNELMDSAHCLASAACSLKCVLSGFWYVWFSQVHQLLAGEGMQVSYRRIPLSRERTPVPQDLSDLYTQIIRKPFSTDRHTVYLILARKATGEFCLDGY
jgi:hypothetical protein